MVWRGAVSVSSLSLASVFLLISFIGRFPADSLLVGFKPSDGGVRAALLEGTLLPQTGQGTGTKEGGPRGPQF